MPKPTDGQILNLLNSVLWNGPVGAAAVHVMRVINEAWDADEVERERGRKALEVAERYAVHKDYCRYIFPPNRCTCGLDEALASLHSDATPSPARWDYSPDAGSVPTDGGGSVSLEDRRQTAGEHVGDEDVEQFNRAQRIRRAAYAAALRVLGYIAMGSPEERAAARYPLKRRVRRTAEDPHGLGTWRVRGDLFQILAGKSPEWRDANSGVFWSIDRVRALAALLAAPFVFEDDVSVEDSGGDVSTGEGT
jgi:hypothetical protein